MYAVRQVISTHVSQLPTHIIAAYVGAVCKSCNTVGNTCRCWQDAEYSPYRWYSDVYDVGIDCPQCTRGMVVLCTCWRVRSMTRCVGCGSELTISKWSKIHGRHPCVKYCSWACLFKI